MIRKVYVEVTVKFDTEGNITPLAVAWKDGTVYKIKILLIFIAFRNFGVLSRDFILRNGFPPTPKVT